jgi:hypothetical protein
MVWDKPRIKSELKRIYRAGQNLSYNALAKRKQSLVSAAAYHFGSYRAAVEAAGIDYASLHAGRAGPSSSSSGSSSRRGAAARTCTGRP